MEILKLVWTQICFFFQSSNIWNRNWIMKSILFFAFLTFFASCKYLIPLLWKPLKLSCLTIQEKLSKNRFELSWAALSKSSLNEDALIRKFLFLVTWNYTFVHGLKKTCQRVSCNDLRKYFDIQQCKCLCKVRPPQLQCPPATMFSVRLCTCYPISNDEGPDCEADD